MRVGDISYLRLVVGIAPADNPHSNGQGGKVKPNPTARERRLLSLAKYWKQKAIKAEQRALESDRKELKVRKEIERQAKSILSVIHS